MGRPRKPTNVLEMSGAFKKNPDRGRARENEPTDLPDIGEAPEHLSGDQRAAWNRLVEIAPPGVLTQADEPAVEMAAKLYAKLRTGEITIQEIGRLIVLLGQFGMTPADRSKVTGRPKTKENKFGALG